MRTPEMGQKLCLGFIADLVIRTRDRDARLLKLLQQLVDRNLENLSELRDRNVRHWENSSI
jgi:hypothetical protein